MRFFSHINRLLLATATLIGTIVGVGMFGLPYVASRAGVGVVVAYLVILGAVVILIHLLYGEVVLRTKGQHRLVGYAERYLGFPGKVLATLVFFFGLYGALLAYMVLGGEFLSFLLGGNVSPFLAGLLLLAAAAYLVGRGLRTIGLTEVFTTAILLSLILGLMSYGSGFVKNANLNLIGGSQYFFLPYGVVLFALWGLSAVPEINGFLTQTPRRLKKAIVLGTLVPILVYIIFTITVVGISGLATSPDAISGLTPYLGRFFASYGALVGFLAVATSVLTIGIITHDSLRLDFRLSRWPAWLTTFAVPLGFYFFITRDFIQIISFVGALALSVEGLLVLAIHARAKKKGELEPAYKVRISGLASLGLAAIFVIALVYQIVSR